MHVQINAKIDDKIDDYNKELKMWIMNFVFKLDNRVTFQFVIYEPYLHSIGEWRDLADAKSEISFDISHGGNIFVDNYGNQYVFAADPSGPDGTTVLSAFRVPIKDVSTKLHKCLDYAIKENLSFAKNEE